MKEFTVPPIYRNIGPVKGLPLNWRDEVTGVLPAAVKAYLDNRIDGTQLDEIQLEIVRVFMEHYINAPCWDHMLTEVSEETLQEIAGERLALVGLRLDVAFLKTPEAMAMWIGRCLDIGIDPL